MKINMATKEQMQKMNLVVTFKPDREMKIRLWLAAQLFRLAARITGMSIEFEKSDPIGNLVK